MAAPRLICLIGAECCGKTTLAQQIAAHTGAQFVPEVLRSWCDAHGRSPRQHEQVALMQAQIAAENQAMREAEKLAQSRERDLIVQAPDARTPDARAPQGLVLCDTAPLLTAVYSLHYFADPSLLAAAHSHHSRYALTLWLQPDLPWVACGLQRDGPSARLKVHKLLAQQLALHAPVFAISGLGPERLQAALAQL